VHGAAGYLLQWGLQLECFSRYRRTLALDLRGHGQSSLVAEANYTADEFAQDLKSLLDHLEIEQVDLVSHSFGGAAATRFALQWPDRLRSLALISTCGRLRVHPAILLLLALPNWLLQPVQKKFNSRVGAPIEVLKKVVPQVKAWNGWDDYPKISTPTLVMCGELDLLTTPGRCKRTASLIPGARYEGISFAAHLPQLERPARVIESLRRFWGEEVEDF
jgi:pimeloyl-ACP methyl ester carboxylesterase